MENELLTPDEAVRILALDRQGLRQPREALRWLCRTGQLRYTKIGRYMRFRRAWLDELIERNECNTPKARSRSPAEIPSPGAGIRRDSADDTSTLLKAE